jgi:hypothetical protein
MSEQNEKKKQELTIEDLEQVAGGVASPAAVPGGLTDQAFHKLSSSDALLGGGSKGK